MATLGRWLRPWGVTTGKDDASATVTSGPAGAVVLRVRVRHLPLLVLAQVSGDVQLRAALSSPRPWDDVARTWAAACAHDGQQQQQQKQGQQGLQGLQAADPVWRWIRAVGGACAQRGLPWVAQQVVLSLVLGEGPKPLSVRLWGGPVGKGQGGVRHASKELAGTFLAAFPRLEAHREALVAEAQKSGFVTTLAGRRVRSSGGSFAAGRRGRVTASVAARLGRELLRAQACHSIADVLRVAAALAVQVRCGGAGQAVQLVASTEDGEMVMVVPSWDASGSSHVGESSLSNSAAQAGQGALGPLPDPAMVSQVHAAVTEGVRSQLGLDVPIVADMAWGPTCDPVCCVPVKTPSRRWLC